VSSGVAAEAGELHLVTRGGVQRSALLSAAFAGGVPASDVGSSRRARTRGPRVRDDDPGPSQPSRSLSARQVQMQHDERSRAAEVLPLRPSRVPLPRPAAPMAARAAASHSSSEVQAWGHLLSSLRRAHPRAARAHETAQPPDIEKPPHPRAHACALLLTRVQAHVWARLSCPLSYAAERRQLQLKPQRHLSESSR
jgi:hypothetical protein